MIVDTLIAKGLRPLISVDSLIGHVMRLSTNTMMYAIIQFVRPEGEDDEVEAVPRCWVDDSRCYWPGHLKDSRLFKAIESRMIPEPDWDVYEPVRILKEIDNYSKARLKCRKIETHMSTDLDTTDVDSRSRKRSRPAKYRSETDSARKQNDCPRESDSDPEDDTTLAKRRKKKVSTASSSVRAELPSLPALPSLNVECSATSSPPFTSRNTASTSVRPIQKTPSSQNIATISATTNVNPSAGDDSFIRTPSRITPRSSGSKDDGVVAVPSDPLERDRLIFSTLLQIKAVVRNNQTAIKRLADKIENVQVSSEEGDIGHFSFPMASEEDVQRVEGILIDKKESKILVNHLTSLGGVSPKDVVERIMSLTFTTTLAKRYNWTGKAPKLPLSKLKVAQAIIEAGKINKMTSAQMEQVIRLWLKNASDRDGGRKIRAQQKKIRDQQQTAQAANRVRDMATLFDTSDESEEEHMHSDLD